MVLFESLWITPMNQGFRDAPLDSSLSCGGYGENWDSCPALYGSKITPRPTLLRSHWTKLVGWPTHPPATNSPEPGWSSGLLVADSGEHHDKLSSCPLGRAFHFMVLSCRAFHFVMLSFAHHDKLSLVSFGLFVTLSRRSGRHCHLVADSLAPSAGVNRVDLENLSLGFTHDRFHWAVPFDQSLLWPWGPLWLVRQVIGLTVAFT